MIGLICGHCGRAYLTFRVFEKLADLPEQHQILHRLQVHIRKENLVSSYPHIDLDTWPKLLEQLGVKEPQVHPSPPVTAGSDTLPGPVKAVPTRHTSAPAPAVTPDSSDEIWWQAYWVQVVALVVGYSVLLCALFRFGIQSRWAEISLAYFAVANLIVLWWYAHNTKQQVKIGQRQVETGQQQYELGLRLRRESNKPFVVLERITKPGEANYFHYAIRNVGPGVAANVFHVVPEPGSESKLKPAGVARFESVGALGPGASRALPDKIEEPLRSAGGRSLGVMFVAEGIATRTDRWTGTLNALTPNGEVLHRIQWLNVQRWDMEISEVLDANWATAGLAQLELQEDAKRHS